MKRLSYFLKALLVFFCFLFTLFLWREYHVGERLTARSEMYRYKAVEDSQQGVSIVDVYTQPLLFVGDVMLGRYVEKLMNKNGDDYPFVHIADFLSSYVVIANLEGPIPQAHIPTPSQGFSFSFPQRTPLVLKNNNITAVSLANNHGLDQRLAGYEHTKKVLDGAGVAHFGANHTTADDYFETEVGTTSVIVFGVNMVGDTWNANYAVEVTKQLQASHPESILVAYVHWGNEYMHAQGVVQRGFAHKLIDSGVDVVVGAHPHVVQGVEKYQGKLIVYSLGNFIFDQYFDEAVEESIGLEMGRLGDDVVFMLRPFQSVRSQVSVATGTKAIKILNVVRTNSSKELQEELKMNEMRIPVLELLNGPLAPN